MCHSLHVVKKPPIKPREEHYVRGKIRVVCPCVDKAKGLQQKGHFVEERPSFLTQRQVENKLKSSQAFGYGVSLTSLPLQCLYAMYDSSS